MKAHIELTCPVDLTPRVRQMAGLYDVPLEAKSSNAWDHDLPIEAQPWSVGLIVGPSGAGKSTLAKHLWPGQVVTGFDWPEDRSLLDGFPDGLGIREVTGLLTGVGLSSPPTWIRPYRTLSTGEAFRATIARALCGPQDVPVVIDEYTSVVDRRVAQVASHTVQKAVRREGRQFVAVSCHFDLEEWLQPDWVYDIAAAQLTWRSVQPHPPLRLEIYKCDRSLWRMFARHHYLSTSLHPGAACFAGYIDGRPVVFTSYLNFPHPHTRNIRMGHRRVVLPDWQGLGIGGQIANWLGQYLYDQGLRYRSVVAHPAMVHFYARSPRWREVTSGARSLHTGSKRSAVRGGMQNRALQPRSLGTRSFEYQPPKKP